jgi:hypothetical protein
MTPGVYNVRKLSVYQLEITGDVTINCESMFFAGLITPVGVQGGDGPRLTIRSNSGVTIAPGANLSGGGAANLGGDGGSLKITVANVARQAWLGQLWALGGITGFEETSSPGGDGGAITVVTSGIDLYLDAGDWVVPGGSGGSWTSSPGQKAGDGGRGGIISVLASSLPNALSAGIVLAPGPEFHAEGGWGGSADQSFYQGNGGTGGTIVLRGTAFGQYNVSWDNVAGGEPGCEWVGEVEVCGDWGGRGTLQVGP